jgi:hypothetical protein
VDVSVKVCVLVEVSVLVEVVCVDEDVRVPRLRDALGVGPSGGLAVSERLGTAIVREALGRLLPPAQEPISRTSIETATTRYPTAARAWT